MQTPQTVCVPPADRSDRVSAHQRLAAANGLTSGLGQVIEVQPACAESEPASPRPGRGRSVKYVRPGRRPCSQANARRVHSLHEMTGCRRREEVFVEMYQSVLYPAGAMLADHRVCTCAISGIHSFEVFWGVCFGCAAWVDELRGGHEGIWESAAGSRDRRAGRATCGGRAESGVMGACKPARGRCGYSPCISALRGQTSTADCLCCLSPVL